MTGSRGRGLAQGCGGLAILVGGWFLVGPFEDVVYRPVAHAAGLHMIEGGAMSLVPYAVLMLVRLVWNLGLVVAVCAALGRLPTGFPLRDGWVGRHLAGGLAIGLAVMVAAIGCIVAMGDGRVSVAAQPLPTAILHGVGWLLFDGIGAFGEELYGRMAVLLVAERLLGRVGAVLVSGLMFSMIHLGNPGVSGIWLFRLFLQGMLLAFAVYRTRSLWWSVGYHAGWNWASAPLFGAAGSGFLDSGHLLDFVPTGPALVTGGAVGPEGSVFAFAAMLAAFGMLLRSRRRVGKRPPPATGIAGVS